MFESMHGIFKFTDMKKRPYQAQEKVHDQGEIQRRNDYHTKLTQIVVQTFDEQLKTGLIIRQAISATNKNLKGTDLCLTHYQVERLLRGAGKFRKQKTTK